MFLVLLLAGVGWTGVALGVVESDGWCELVGKGTDTPTQAADVSWKKKSGNCRGKNITESRI